MPTWGEILKALQTAAATNPHQVPPLDEYRRQSLRSLSLLTGRPAIAYFTRWLQGPGTGNSGGDMMVTHEDMIGFMEAVHGLPGPSLDLILHSSGGLPTAAEALINYLRTKFDDIRVIVPVAAMSAGTMMACGANRLVLGKHSYLGPTDPQMLLQTPLGMQVVPAFAILEQFEMAKKQANAASFAAWIPMLQQYGPGLLKQCEMAVELSEQLVAQWLQQYMFTGSNTAVQDAQRIAKELADHRTHKAHGRFLTRNKVRAMGLIVEDLELSQPFQDAVLTVLHTFMHTFSIALHVNKIVENSLGKSWIKMSVQSVVTPQPSPHAGPQPPTAPPPSPPVVSPSEGPSDKN